MKRSFFCALVLSVLLSAQAAAASPLARQYAEGETLKYRITGKMVNNGRDYSGEAESTVKKSSAGVFYEELKWTALSEENLKVPADFRQYVSLDPLFKPQMPAIMSGAFLDTFNFYVDLMLAIKQSSITTPGDRAYIKRSLPNSWAFGDTLVGYDCIDFDIEFKTLDKSGGTATVTVKHVPPQNGCSVAPPAEWMRKPVADTANNFFQVKKRADGTYGAGVAKEFFDVEIKLEVPSGRILSAKMHNPVTGFGRTCKDEKLSDCGEPEPFSLVRNISMELVSPQPGASAYTIDAFSSAVLNNNTGLVDTAIKSGININQKDSNGTYPLEHVLPFGNCEMARALLEAGADPDVKTAGGQTIYQVAMDTRNTTLIKIFKKHRKSRGHS